MSRIFVLHENPAWLPPFASAFDRLGLPWDEFRSRLIAAIADDPERPYYESWAVALEQLVVLRVPRARCRDQLVNPLLRMPNSKKRPEIDAKSKLFHAVAEVKIDTAQTEPEWARIIGHVDCFHFERDCVVIRRRDL